MRESIDPRVMTEAMANGFMPGGGRIGGREQSQRGAVYMTYGVRSWAHGASSCGPRRIIRHGVFTNPGGASRGSATGTLSPGAFLPGWGQGCQVQLLLVP